MIKDVLPAKRRILLFALICMLLGTTLFGYSSASESLMARHLCTNSLHTNLGTAATPPEDTCAMDNDTVDANLLKTCKLDGKMIKGTGGIDDRFMIAGLITSDGSSDKNWLGQPKYRVFMSGTTTYRVGKSASPLGLALNSINFLSGHILEVQEHTSVDKNMRLFLTSSNTAVLFYYDKQGNLKIENYTMTGE